MPRNFRALSVLFASSFTFILSSHAQTYTETPIAQFNDGNGSQPRGGLVQASDGNFYAAIAQGGSADGGTIVKVTPSGTLTVLYNSTGDGGTDGFNYTGPLTLGPDGALYGIASQGGSPADQYCYAGCGTVFKITTNGKFSVIHVFLDNGTDGYGPNGGLALASDGNLYGTASNGGKYSAGTIFQITTAGGYSTVYNFTAAGDLPGNAPVQGSDGYLYGTSNGGGSNTAGVFYKVALNGSGFTDLLNLDGVTYIGATATALAEGSDDNFYGASINGGDSTVCGGGCGQIFKITPAGKYSTLYSFTGGADGNEPFTAPVIASDGNFYGDVNADNFYACCGSLWKLTYGGEFSTIYTFTGGSDGAYPASSLMQANTGAIFGLTQEGGDYQTSPYGGDGVVFKLAASPALAAPVQLTFSSASVAAGTAVTLDWKVLNAFSTTAQQCYAFVQNAAAGAGTWTGKQSGSYSASTKLLTGSASITPTANGSYTYALTCGGVETGFATLTVTASTKKSSTTALTATPNPASVGQSVTLKATITGSGATPTGTVTFSYGSDVLHTATLSGAAASFAASTNGLPPGTYAITAKYSGDTNYNTSSGSNSVKLEESPTTTTLTASPTSVTPPASVTLTATVKRSASGASGTPTGSVTFYANGSDALVTVKLNSSGVAAINASSSGYPAGKYAITAKYLGDSSDVASTSAAVDVTVK